MPRAVLKLARQPSTGTGVTAGGQTAITGRPFLALRHRQAIFTHDHKSDSETTVAALTVDKLEQWDATQPARSQTYPARPC